MKTNFYLKKPLLLVVLLVGLVFTMNGQNQNQVTGTIVDGDNLSLPGASVLEKGTSNGVVSDFDGKFTLNVSNPNAILVVSYVGFVSKDLPLNGQKNIQITLEEDIAQLDQIVVIAYGEQKLANVSGALTSISSEDLEGRPVANFQSALQGQVAGLNITSNTGAPGGGASVVIRGKGSFSGSTEPLYVIDGNIMNNYIGNQGQGYTNPNPLSTISPSDIESITVLKDASAASIYGNRGANGVILITTKRGKKGKPQFEFNTYVATQTAANTLDLLNTQQYQQVLNTARDNAGAPRIPALDGTNLTTYTNWQDEILRTALMTSNEFRASGGGDNTRYSTSVGYVNQEGIVIKTGLERFNINLNTDSEFGKFKVGNTLNVSRTSFDKEKNGAAQTILNWAIISAPNIPVYDANNVGGYAGPTVSDGEPTLNPVAAQNLVTNVNTVNRILGNVYASYELVKGLTFRVNAGFDYITFHDRYAVPVFNLNQNQVPGFEQGALVREYRGENNSILLENTLNYKHAFGKHNLDLLGGYNVQETHFADMKAQVAGGFTGTGLPVLSGSNKIPSVGGIISEGKTTSIIGRVIYDYDGRYLATANFRRDGSSKFVGDNAYGNFYSGSVGWNIAKEAFMENSVFSDLKLRASYGSLGNDGINSNSARFTLNQNATYVLGANQVLAAGVGPSGSMQNSDLVWESQVQTNFGIDFGLFNNKFTMTVDHFKKTSKDLIITVPVPGHTGFGSITLNAGEIENTGWEATARYRGTVGDDFSFGIGANITTLDNEVKFLNQGLKYIERDGFGELSSVLRSRIAPGHSVQSFYGYQVESIFQNQAEIDNAPTQSILTGPGDFKYRDIDGNGVLDAKDQTFIGDAIPNFTYGFNLNMEYKNWDFSAQFQGVSGNDIWSDTKYYTQSYARTNNLSKVVLNAWTPSNPSTTIPRALPAPLSDNKRVSDFFIEDGSYFRLKNLQVGYAFPDVIKDKLSLAKLRLYFSGQNLFTISKYNETGYDPEVGSNGIDNVVYPVAKVFTVGLQVGF